MYLRLSPYQEILQGILTDLQVNEGIVKITGKSGSGKTALCTQLCQELQDSGQPAVLLLKPPADVNDLQKDILTRLDLDASGNFTRTLTAYLAAQTNSTPLVLIFDDAHLLDQHTLGAIRMLCNIQNQSRALIRVIVCGDSELDAKLATPALRAVAQFLSQSVSLPYLTRDQVHDFCMAYWQAAGVDMKPLDAKFQQKLYRETQGHPGILRARLEQGTTGAEQTERGKTDVSVDSKARAPGKYADTRPGWIPGLLIILVLLVLGGAGIWLYFFTSPAASGVSALAPNGTMSADINAPPRAFERVEEPTEREATEQTAAPALIPAVEETVESIAVEDTVEAPVPAAPATSEVSPEPELAEAIVTAESPATSVESFLAEWARSWQARDVDSYLALYHESFVPPQGFTRGAWEQQRRNVIGNARDLVITVDKPLSNTEAQNGMRFVRFWLNYCAANYSDRTLKEVLLVPVAGSWRIRVENNLRTEGL